MLDWRVMNPEQWTLVKTAMQEAHDQGADGPPTATLIGSNFSGSGGWNGGALGANGRIYGVPAEARQVLEIDPVTNTTTLIGPVFDNGNKWNGGALGPDGVIYCAPFDATTVLRIDTNRVPATVDNTLTAPTGDGLKWGPPVRAYDGKIYAFPQEALSVLVIDPTVTPPAISEIALANNDGATLGMTGGGLLNPLTGKLYAVPYSAKHILEVDPVSATATWIEPTLTGSWYGMTLGADDVMYAVPGTFAASGILRINFSSSPVTIDTIASTMVQADGAKIVPSGLLVAAPWIVNATARVLTFDPATAITSSVAITPAPSGSTRLWAGVVLAGNNHAYLIPTTAAFVVDVDPHARGSYPLDVLLGGFVNTY